MVHFHCNQCGNCGPLAFDTCPQVVPQHYRLEILMSDGSIQTKEVYMLVNQQVQVVSNSP